MTTFVKNQFVGSVYVTYGGRFVARFKHNRRDRRHFINFLVSNFEVEEYFAKLDAGMTPQGVLAEKGYVSTTVMRTLERHGYAPTKAGLQEYLADQRVERGVAPAA